MNSFNLKLFNFSSFKKIVASITLTCFVITILYTSGFSSIFEDIKDKRKSPEGVYHRWATVSEQIQGKRLTEFEDKEKNQVYRFDKEVKLVELEDRNKGVIFKYTYDEKGKPKVEVVDLKQKESQNVETSKEKQEKHTKQQDELTLAKAELFTNKLLAAPPEKQQKMLESIELSVEEAKNLSKEEIKQKVIEYIQTNKNLPEGEVTIKQLTQNLQQLLNNTRNALTMLFASIIKQLVGEKKKEQQGEVLVSIEDIQQAVEKQGIKLNSSNINFEQLKETLKSSPVFVHLKDGDKGLFLIVTDIKDDKVIGIDANGKKTVIMDFNQFLFKWDGKTLSVANLGEELDGEIKKNTKGTFFAKLFDDIKKIFTTQSEITQQTTTQTNQTDAQQAISYIEQWLNEYLNADPAKKAQMAVQLGLSVDQLANLTAEKVQNIIAYLKSHADSIINCAVEALSNVLNSAGKVVQAAEIAAKAILVDILTGNFQITSTSTYDASQVQISAFALQKVAASFGVALFGYSTDIEGLKQALQKGHVIVWMDLGNGMGHYVTVTSIQNGQVIYKDSDGKTYTISVEEFKSKAKGGLKVLSQKEGIKGEKLTEEGLKELKGAVGAVKSEKKQRKAVKKSSVSSAAGAVKSAVSRAASSVSSAESRAASSVKSAESRAASSVRSSVSSAASSVRSAGSNEVNKVVNSVSSVAKSVRSAVSGAVSSVSNFFTNTVPDFFTNTVAPSVTNFFTDTVPNFFTKTVPDFFTNTFSKFFVSESTFQIETHNSQFNGYSGETQSYLWGLYKHTTINTPNGRKLSSSDWFGADPKIDIGNNQYLQFEKDNNQIKITKGEIETKEYFDPYSGYVSYNSYKPTLHETITSLEDGRKNVSGMELLGGNKARYYEGSQQGKNRSYKEVVGEYVGDQYKPSELNNINGSVAEYKGDNLMWEKELGGSLKNIEWDQMQLKAFTPDNYTEKLVYTSNPNEQHLIGLTEIYNGGRIEYRRDSQISEKEYAEIIGVDVKNLKEQNKIDNEWFTSQYGMVEICRGVNKQVISPDGKVIQDLTINQITAKQEKQYSQQGIDIYGKNSQEVSLRWASNITDNLKGIQTTVLNGKQTTILDSEGRVREVKRDTGEYQTTVVDPLKTGLDVPKGTIIEWKRDVENIKYNYVGEQKNPSSKEFDITNYDYINRTEEHRVGTEEYLAYKGALPTEVKTYENTNIYSLDNKQPLRSEVSYTHEKNIRFEGQTRISNIAEQTTAVLHGALVPSIITITNGKREQTFDILGRIIDEKSSGNVKVWELNVDKLKENHKDEIEETVKRFQFPSLKSDIPEDVEIHEYTIKENISINNLKGIIEDIVSNTLYKFGLLAHYDFNQHKFNFNYDILDRTKSYQFERNVVNYLESEKSGNYSGRVEFNYTDKVEQIDGRNVLKTTYDATTIITHINGEKLDEPQIEKQEGLNYSYNFGYQNPIDINIETANILRNEEQARTELMNKQYEDRDRAISIAVGVLAAAAVATVTLLTGGAALAVLIPLAVGMGALSGWMAATSMYGGLRAQREGDIGRAIFNYAMVGVSFLPAVGGFIGKSAGLAAEAGLQTATKGGLLARAGSAALKAAAAIFDPSGVILGSYISRGFGAITATSTLARFAINTATTLTKVAIPMFKNILVYGNYGVPYLPKFDGLVPIALKSAGVDLSNNEIYQAIANLFVIAPIIAESSFVKSAGGEAEKVLFSRDTLKGIGGAFKYTFKHPTEALKALFNWEKLSTLPTAAKNLSLREMWNAVKPEIVENIVNFAPRTVQIVGDVVVFNMIGSTIGGAINTLLGGKERQWWIFYLPNFKGETPGDTFKNFITKTSAIAVNTATEPTMWAFGIGVGIASPILSPILKNLPVFGPVMEKISSYDSFFGGRLGKGFFGRFQAFIYEEGFQEQIPEFLLRGLDIKGLPSEVLQEMFDKGKGGILKNINAELSQRISKVDSGYVSNVDSIKKLDMTKATPLAIQSINRVLEQKLGSGGINVGEISTKLVGSAQTTQELRYIMVSVAAVSDAGLIREGVQIEDIISQNSQFLQNNPQISKLTTDQQIRFLTSVNELGAINERGELNIDKIKNSNDVDTLSNFVINTIPLLEGRDYSENFHSAFSEGLSRLNELVKQTPSINNISKLADVCSFLLNSRIKTNQANISDIFTTLAVSLSNLDIKPAVSKEKSSPQEMDVYQQTIDQLIPSLDLLGSVILAKGNSQLLNLFTSAVSSNLSLRNMINLWTIQQLSLKQTETPPVLQSIVDSVGKYDINTILRSIDTSTDIQTKLILLNFASTVLAERRLVGSEVSAQVVGRINGAIKSLDLQQIQENTQLTNLLLSTIAKLNVVNGITGVEENVYGEGINNFVKANEGKFNEIKEVAQRSYGRVVEVRREIKDIVDFAEEVVKQEDSSQVRSLFEAKLREIYSERLKDGSPQKYETEKLISSILARYDNLVEKISDKLPAAVLISFVEQRVAEWKEDPKFSFNDAQLDAFVNIVDAIFEEKQQHRYTHVLQTGGGKTFLAVASAMLLRAQTPQTEFVAVFSNTIDNAKDVYKHITGIFGDLLGSVVIISSDDLEKSRQNPQELREKLASASIVVTTYDIWSGLIADTFSKLLSEDKPYGKQNIELLNKNGINVIRDAKGRITFEDATQARQALNLLLSQGYNREITDISLPLDRIGSAVADEIDFFSTIPMQALAVSMGKYHTAERFVEYYEELSKLSIKTKVTQSDITNLVKEYRDIGIDLARVNRDLQSASQNAEYLQQVRQMYENIGELVKNGKSKDDIMKEISVPEGISKEQVSSEVEQLVNNRIAIQYFHRLADITKDLYEKSNAYEGTIKIGDKVIKISDIWQFGSKSLVQEILGLEVKEDTKELQQKVSKKAEEVDVRELISKHAEELEQEFKGLFSKAEIIEHLWNGIGAHGLKEGNEYYVKDGRVWVTNLGRGVENLMLPSGMMQVLELKHNLDISKPNAETYISNSVFAMSLFSDIVGLTGTVSKGVDSSVLSRMGFKKNGTAPKVESHWRLFQTQKGMVRFIIEATRHINNKGVANFNLILTPNSAISRMAYETLLKESGISKEEIKYVGPDVSDAELEELRKEVMQGKYKFVIADAYLLGRGWNVGKMLDAANVFKEKQNATAEKVQATLWLLEPHLMTETQMLQAAGRIDPFGNNRFDTSAYTKDIISLVSIESAIEVERLRKAANANEKGGWTIDIITDNLQKVQLENEQEALRRAGQKVVVLAEEAFIQQQKQSPPTVKEAKEILNQNGVAKETQQKILQQIGIQPTPQATETQQLTPEQHFRLNTILKIHNLLKAVLPDEKANEIVSNINPQELASLGSVKQEEFVPSVMKFVLDKSKDEEGIDKNNVKKLENILKAIQDLNSAREQLYLAEGKLSYQQIEEYNNIVKQLQNKETSLIDKIKLGFSLRRKYPEVYKAQKELAKLSKKFEKQKENIADKLISQQKSEVASLVLGITLDKEGNLRFDEERIKEVRNILVNLHQLGLSIESVKVKDIKDVVEGKRTSISLIENLAKRQNNEQLQGMVSRLNEKFGASVGLNEVEVIANELGMPKEQIISIIDLTTNPQQTLSEKRAAGIQSDILSVYNVLKQRLQQKVITLEEEKQLIDVIITLQQQPRITVATYKESYEILQQLFRNTSNINELYEALYNSLKSNSQNKTLKEAVESLPKFTGQVSVINTITGSDQEIKEELKEVLSLTKNWELLIQVYTPKLDVKNKGVIIKLDESGELLAKIYDSKGNEEVYKTDEAVAKLRELGVFNEGNIMAVSIGDAISAAKFGMLPLSSIIMHTHPQEASLKVSLADRKVLDVVSNTVMVNFVNNLVGYLLDKATRLEAEKKQKEFEEKVGQKENEIVTEVQNTQQKVNIGEVKPISVKGVGECVMIYKPEYQIIYYFVDDKQKVGEEKNKYAQIKQVLGDKVVRFAVLDKQINNKQAVIIVREKVESLDTVKPEIGLKQVAEINKVLWMYKMRDVELGNNEDWKNNYGVNSRGEVVLSNPIVVSNEAIPENKPIGEIVKINDELKSGGYLKESDLTCWGSPRGPRLDPLGLGRIASILSDVATKGKELRSIPILIRGAA